MGANQLAYCECAELFDLAHVTTLISTRTHWGSWTNKQMLIYLQHPWKRLNQTKINNHQTTASSSHANEPGASGFGWNQQVGHHSNMCMCDAQLFPWLLKWRDSLSQPGWCLTENRWLFRLSHASLHTRWWQCECIIWWMSWTRNTCIHADRHTHTHTHYCKINSK